MIDGVLVGHAQDVDACTGCTILIGPFRAAVDIRGMATGTREIDVLSPLHLVDRVDAILLTGGSAFGLAAADGVMAWLEENGRGFDTGSARVPIVPTAVIYDLGVGSASVRPDASMGRAACVDAMSRREKSADVDNASRGKRVGAGTGASAGKLLGAASATRTGVGTASLTTGGYTVAALAVVNPLGDVIDGRGDILAGARDASNAFIGSRDLLMQTNTVPFAVQPGTNTTLVAVATDAPLSRVDLQRLARVASTGVARRIAPVNTPFDGDVVFALSTSDEVHPTDATLMLALGSLAASAVEQAIENSI
jgi:L-aminopeptidase/D-esterase-like protein